MYSILLFIIIFFFFFCYISYSREFYLSAFRFPLCLFFTFACNVYQGIHVYACVCMSYLCFITQTPLYGYTDLRVKKISKNKTTYAQKK